MKNWFLGQMVFFIGFAGCGPEVEIEVREDPKQFEEQASAGGESPSGEETAAPTDPSSLSQTEGVSESGEEKITHGSNYEGRGGQVNALGRLYGDVIGRPTLSIPSWKEIAEAAKDSDPVVVVSKDEVKVVEVESFGRQKSCPPKSVCIFGPLVGPHQLRAAAKLNSKAFFYHSQKVTGEEERSIEEIKFPNPSTAQEFSEYGLYIEADIFILPADTKLETAGKNLSIIASEVRGEGTIDASAPQTKADSRPGSSGGDVFIAAKKMAPLKILSHGQPGGDGTPIPEEWLKPINGQEPESEDFKRVTQSNTQWVHSVHEYQYRNQVDDIHYCADHAWWDFHSTHSTAEGNFLLPPESLENVGLTWESLMEFYVAQTPAPQAAGRWADDVINDRLTYTMVQSMCARTYAHLQIEETVEKFVPSPVSRVHGQAGEHISGNAGFRGGDTGVIEALYVEGTPPLNSLKSGGGGAGSAGRTRPSGSGYVGSRQSEVRRRFNVRLRSFSGSEHHPAISHDLLPFEKSATQSISIQGGTPPPPEGSPASGQNGDSGRTKSDLSAQVAARALMTAIQHRFPAAELPIAFQKAE